MGKNARELKPQDVRRTFKGKALEFADTTAVKPYDGIIGAERALDSLEDAILVGPRKGWNVWLQGGRTGKREIATMYLEKHGQPPTGLQDILLVHNFSEEFDVERLYVPVGQGKALKADVASLMDSVAELVPKLLRSEDYLQLERAHEQIEDAQEAALQQRLDKIGATLKTQQYSSGTALVTSKVVLPKEGSAQGTLDTQKAQELANHYQDGFQQRKKELAEMQEAALKRLATPVIEEMFKALVGKYQIADAAKWLGAFQGDVVANLDAFKTGKGASAAPVMMDDYDMPMGAPTAEDPLKKYEVVVAVDNSSTPTDKPLIIYEDEPKPSKMIGKQKVSAGRSLLDGMKVDHTAIELGSLVKAKGGYFVVDLDKLLLTPGAWQTFETSLERGEVRLADTLMGMFGMEMEGQEMHGISLDDVKIVLVGSNVFDDYLKQHPLVAPFLEDHFKVPAVFESRTDITTESLEQLVGYVAHVSQSEKLMPLDSEGVKAAMEYLVRQADSQKEFALKLGNSGLSDVLVEADLQARKRLKSSPESAKVISRADVQGALDRRHYRNAAIEERYRRAVREVMQTVALDGERVGEAHALSVYVIAEDSDTWFGMPTKATANAMPGSGGVVNIMEVVKMSGKTYNYGMAEMESFLGWKFGQEKPLSFTASIIKEECYSGIDGNSSSALNTVVLLSELSGKPILQRRAMTGGITQKGEVVAIGGVNTKIEGFYKVCKEYGILDKHSDAGVVIPEANVNDLQLHPEVVQAISEGKFHVWAVSHIDAAVPMMMGIGATELQGVYEAAGAKLLQYTAASEDSKGKGKKAAPEEESPCEGCH